MKGKKRKNVAAALAQLAAEAAKPVKVKVGMMKHSNLPRLRETQGMWMKV